MSDSFAFKPIMSQNRNGCSPSDGYVLYFVLVFLIILSVSFIVAVTHSSRTHILSLRLQQEQQARMLAESGIVRTEFFLNGGDAHNLHWETDSFAETLENWGTIKIACKPFGVFSRLQSQGIRLRRFCMISGLLGRNPPKIMDPLLTITGSTRGLVLDDQSTIAGKVVLDYGPVVRGAGKRPIPGSERWVENRVSPCLPFDSTSLDSIFDALETQLAASLSAPDAITGDVAITASNDTLLRHKPLVVLGNARIGDIKAANAMIVAAKSVIIESGAILTECSIICDSFSIANGSTDKCLFYSRKKMALGGGTHGSQFFCKDSIAIGESVRAGSASVWISRRSVEHDTIRHGGIVFAAQGDYRGCAICYSDTADRRRLKVHGPAIVLNEKCDFSGYLVSDGDVEIAPSRIKGRIWAQSVTGVENTMKALHWLYRTSIMPLDEDLPFPLLGEMPAKVKFEKAAMVYGRVNCEGRVHVAELKQ
jgi:hypothetical protein